MVQYGFFFDQSRCYGCQACSTACKDWNGIGPGPEKWMTVYEWEEGTFPTTRIHTLAFSCAHCAEPACMAACPEGAIFKEPEFGAVLVDQDKCVGCRKCKEACPYGSPKYASDAEDEKMSKCTMCIDKLVRGEQPQCALSCPMRALDFGPIEDLAAKYGDVRHLKGMPECESLGPSVVYKPMQEKKALLPFDAKKVLELNAVREGLPDLYSSSDEVTDIPDGLLFRGGLRMKHASVADLMRATRNDLG